MITLRLLFIAVMVCSFSITKAQDKFDFFHDSLTAYEHFELVKKINRINNKVASRSMKTHKLDSIYFSSTNQGTSPLELARKELFCYTDTIQVSKWFGYSDDSRTWTPSLVYKYKLNSSNDMLTRSSLHLYWNGEDEAVDTLSAQRLDDFIYNENDLIDTISLRTENPFGLNVVRSFNTYSYNDESLLNRIRTFRRLTLDSLLLITEIVYSYNDKNELVSIVDFQNNPTLGWAAIDSVSLKYNSSGSLQQREEYLKLIDGTWIQNYYYLYSNYQNGSPGTIEIENYDLLNGGINFKVQETISSQVSGDPDNMDGLLWNDGEELGFAYGYYLDHDSNILNDRVLYPEAYSENRVWNNMILEEYAYNNYINSPIFLEHVQQDGFLRSFYYSKIDRTSVEDEDVSLLVNIFPNPVADVINIVHENIALNRTELQIFNSNGLRVSSGSYLIGDSYSVVDLPPGIYFFKIYDGKKTFTEKFVKI